MSVVALGEVVDFYSGGTPSKSKPEYWTGDVPWFSAKDLKKSRLSDSIDHVSPAAFTSTPLRKVPAGTVVMVVRGMILAHTVPIAVLEVDAAINQDLKALVPRTDIEPSYLAGMLSAQHSSILSQVSTAAHGTKKLDTRVLEQIQIPLPTITEQRRIASILENADALCVKRRRVLAHLDALVPSIFHAMFGDPSHAVDQIHFGEVATLSGGRNLVAADAGADSPYRVLKISAVTTGRFKSGETKPLPMEYVPPDKHLVLAGDLLMSRANTTELVGAVALVSETPPNLALPDKVWRFDWHDDRSNPTYFHALFRTPAIRRRISRLASGTGGSMKNVSKSKLETMLLPDIPTARQHELASRAQNVAEHRAKAELSLAALDALFTSLQSRAFRGDL